MSCSCAGDLANIYGAIGNLEGQFNYITGNTMSNYNQLSRIVSQQSNIYNTIYYGLGNLSTGNLIINNNYLINGNLLLPTGNLLISSGNILSTVGNILINNGNLGITTGNISMNNGNLGITAGNILMNNGNLGITSGNILMNNGNLGITRGNILMNNGNLGITRGNLILLNGNLGIGTSSPFAAIDISGNTRITGNLNIDNGTMWVEPINNRVGINNTNPQYDLDVKGSANISTELNISGYSAFTVRAYVRFYYISSIVIQAQSSLISSVTRSGVGQYTINFSPNLPTSNYLVFGNGYESSSFNATKNTSVNIFNLTTSSCKINITDATNNSFTEPEDNACVFILF